MLDFWSWMVENHGLVPTIVWITASSIILFAPIFLSIFTYLLIKHFKNNSKRE